MKNCQPSVLDVENWGMVSKTVYTFTEADAERILRIPLARSPHEDFLIWGGENSGEFTVRSAYQLLQRSTDNPRAYAV